MNRHPHPNEVKHALQFAGKVLLVIGGLLIVLLLLRAAFQLSMWMGFAILGVYTVALYASAHRWVAWLPGLLVFGVFNSLVALVTGHSPTNFQVNVSTNLALLLLAFYAVGFVLSYLYATRLSQLDRCAWLLYFASMILPASAPGSSQGGLTPAIVGSALSGMAVVAVSFVIHRKLRHKAT